MEQAWIHPETDPGELFVSNMTGDDFESFEWDSKRKGDDPYDGEGHRLVVTDWFPVFIAERELTERRMTIAELRRALRREVL